MSYSVVFTDEAKADFDKLPPLVASELLNHLDLLASSPATHSVRVYFPYRNLGQLFVCRFDLDDVAWRITVGFVYGSDEQTLFLLWIAAKSTPTT